MASHLDISAKLTGIAHVLRDSMLTVPPFQRNYSWKEEEVEEFWFDLRAALTTDMPYYFMGTIVISGSGRGRAVVIDGQQRLATTTLLLTALRNAFRRGGEDRRATAVDQNYLTALTLVSDRVEPRLQLNEIDSTYFNALVIDQQEGVDVQARPRLQAAFHQLERYVLEEVQAAGPRWVDQVIRWVDFLDERAQIILMETADDGDAFMVFETLNDRGLPLAVADVIKNYFFSLTRDRIGEAQADWLSAVQSIEDATSAGGMTDFIRQWWNSKSGATRERDLYSFLRAAIRSQDQALAAVSDLASKAPAYAALIDQNHLLWEDQTGSARQAARVLFELGLEQYRPLGLAALSMLEPEQTSEILRATVNWSVRALVGGGAGGGTAERVYSEAAVRVTNGRARSVDAVFDDVNMIVPRDAEFATAFATRKVSRSSTLRYILRSLLYVDPLAADYRDDFVPVPMFPRNATSSAWEAYGERDELSDVYGRLGNYLLLPRSEAKNVPSSPQERFDFLTQVSESEGGTIEPWTYLDVDEVARRQDRMATLAIAVWPTFPLIQSGGGDGRS